jgi:tetratricopeptide (TPR) repeat protein
MSTWIQNARRFIVTSEEGCLEQAISLCNDQDIARFLSDPDLRANRQLHPSRFEALVDRLLVEGRVADASVVNWLGYRFVALAVSELETYGDEHQAFIHRTCAALAEQSTKLGFTECQALFVGLLATGAAKLRKDDQCFALFDQAIGLARQLVASGGHEYAQLLAGLLSNFGNALRFAGRHGDAIMALTESVSILRQLSAQDSNRHLEHLASSLSNLAAALGADKRFHEVEGPLVEAASIQRRLAREKPKLRRALAGTLSNLAFLHIEQRRYREARTIVQETLAIRRALSAELPEVHLPDLAATLNNFGMLLGDLRDYSGAIHMLHETISIRRGLARKQPSVFEPDLAATLNNLGNTLVLSGSSSDMNDGLAAYSEALEIRRRLASQDPRLYEPTLAQTLGNLAALRCDLGHHAAAAVTFQEVATILAKFCQISPEPHEPQLAGCLGNLGQTLFRAGDHTAARRILEDSVALWRRLASKEPEAYEGELAGTLNDLALVLSKLGSSKEAMRTAKEAIGLAERLQGHVHLAKGDVSGAYWLVISDCVRRSSSKEVFAALATVRDPAARLIFGPTPEGLAAARASLNGVERATGMSIRFLIVEKLSDDRAFFGVLQSDGKDTFRYEISERFVLIARSLFALLHEPFTDEDAMRRGVDAAQAREVGLELWERLPPFVRETLHPANQHDVLICGDPDSLDLPWEALHLGPGDVGWLGLHRHLTRIPDLSQTTMRLLGPRRRRSNSLSAAIICPWDVPGQAALNGALAEAKEVAALLQRAGYSLLPEGKPLLSCAANMASMEAVLTASPAVLHFAGHGDIVRGEVALVLSGAGIDNSYDLFDRRSLAEIRAKSRRTKILSSSPIVVLNACWAGRSRAFGGQREDLASAFLAEGASCVVACPTPVYDDVGQMLATLLYVPSIQHKQGLGKTFQQVRSLVARRLHDEAHWWTWFWMRSFGNPYTSIPLRRHPRRSLLKESGSEERSKALDLIRDLI